MKYVCPSLSIIIVKHDTWKMVPTSVVLGLGCFGAIVLGDQVSCMMFWYLAFWTEIGS